MEDVKIIKRMSYAKNVEKPIDIIIEDIYSFDEEELDNALAEEGLRDEDILDIDVDLSVIF